MSEESVSTPQGSVEGSTSPESGAGNTEVAKGGDNPSESSKEASKKEVAEKLSKHKLTIDGKEEEVDLDELKAGYSKAKAATERFQKAAEERKAAEKDRQEAKAMLDRMKSNPWEVMKELGLDPRTTSEDYLIEQLKLDALTPEQKKAMELERRVKAYEDKEASAAADAEAKAKKDKEAKEREEIAVRSQQIAKEYEEQFLEALTGSTLPKKPGVVKKIAEKMFQASEEGYEMSVKQAIKLVEKEIKEYQKAFIDDLDEEALAAFLGENNLKKVRKRDVSNLKNPVPKAESKPQDKEEKPSAPQSPDEWLKSIKKQHGILK